MGNKTSVHLPVKYRKYFIIPVSLKTGYRQIICERSSVINNFRVYCHSAAYLKCQPQCTNAPYVLNYLLYCDIAVIHSVYNVEPETVRRACFYRANTAFKCIRTLFIASLPV